MVCFMICCTSSTSRRSRNSHGRRQSKNPYSSRGLDKFAALLNELDEKRQKIYSETGEDQLPVIRFVYTSSNECVPLVIRPKERLLLSDQEVKKKKKSCMKTFKEKDTTQNPKSTAESKSDSEKPESDEEKKLERRKECTLSLEMHRMKRPSYYLPVTLILILVFLALFGRSFAIMSTCTVWYTVPAIKGWSSNGKKMSMKKRLYARKLSNGNEGNNSMKKKDYVRKFSNESRGSASPGGRDFPVMKEKSPCLAAHRKTG